MEALTAASVAALTIYDMVKGVERGVEIRAVRLVSKTGGKSGDWHRPADRRRPATPDPRRRPGERVAGRIGGGKRARPGDRTASARSALVLTASDRSRGRDARGRDRARRSRSASTALGFVVEREVVADDRAAIEGALRTARRATRSSSRPAARA